MRALPLIVLAVAAATLNVAAAQPIQQTVNDWRDAFRQLEGEDWPTPNRERRATGAPGPDYWQQQVDYDIRIHLDEREKTLTGSASISYTNNAPDTLDFLWFQLEQNRFRPDSIAVMTETVGGGGRSADDSSAELPEGVSSASLRRRHQIAQDGYGYNIRSVTDADGNAVPFTVVDTLMRVDLDDALETGESVILNIEWDYRLIETSVVGGRAGWECFEETETTGGDCIFQVAQFFPRAAVFSDYEGWHNKAFLGRGEFTLEFGDYDVAITVPQDFLVAATGELQNPEDVLTQAQRDRLEQARTASDPVFIQTPAEARANERRGTRSEATWHFHADNVRDFAWAGSRKFIWDAMGVSQEGEGIAPDTVMAMSFYPNEAEPLWSTFSTRTVAHTLAVYSSFSFPYSYPVAQSIAGPQGGMEYPMITFNGGTYGRPVVGEDGNLTYSRTAKRGLIGVIIHEIGHIYFPMTVNSDERQWTWMDEGLNTFLQYQAEQQWEAGFPSRRGDPRLATDYMTSTGQVPIMTQSDSVLEFGNNAYGKPATALVVLRETILGRELFDEAFRTYARRWRFKRPTPYDFFRTMEEVSGVDLDWFWRGWFYSTDHVDISLDRVIEGTLDTQNPTVENARERAELAALPEGLTPSRNRQAGISTYASEHPQVVEFYSANDAQTVTAREREAYASYRAGLEDWETDMLASGERVYYLDFTNQGGVVMPIILEFTFADGSTEMVRIPAEVWRYDSRHVTWSYLTNREVVSVELDPLLETADSDRSDNYFPPRIEPTRLELYRADAPSSNMMADQDQRVSRDSIRARPE
ncbi:M1 family metallopeptidase [uncultured Maricaulis sp.]|uniref:M1 family metallopeptidase n=1 Tax=uncultured Maricaulis sp. TaxID=174710 RepID=UPI0030DAF8D9|tara:strand:- start:138817 stop:141252 length:2436 start_codon:yes stop_codon:yes gene_type:complete